MKPINTPKIKLKVPKMRLPKFKLPRNITVHKRIASKVVKTSKSLVANTKLKKILAVTLVTLAVVVFIGEAVFAGLIYIGKMDNNITGIAAKIVPYPMTIVNFSSVSVADYNFEKNYISHFYNQAQKEIPAGINSQIVDQLIQAKLLEQKASTYNVQISSQEIDDTINTLADQNGGTAEVEKILNQYYGLTVKQFRTLVKSQLLQVKMKDTVPAQVKASHILIKVDKGADQATVDAAKAKADGIYKELVAGTDFAEKAKAVSDDTGSRDAGGDLGFFGYGDMVKEFQGVAFNLKVNEISQPVRTDYGWHIIKVTDRKGFEPMSFDDWIKQLRANAFIKQLIVFP